MINRPKYLTTEEKQRAEVPFDIIDTNRLNHFIFK